MSGYSTLSNTFFSAYLHTFQSAVRHMASKLVMRNFSKEEQAVLFSSVSHEGNCIFQNDSYFLTSINIRASISFLLTESKLLWAILEKRSAFKPLCGHFFLVLCSVLEN